MINDSEFLKMNANQINMLYKLSHEFVRNVFYL